MINAGRYDELLGAVQRQRKAERALGPVARMLAHATPRPGQEASGWRAVRELADRALTAAR